MTQIGLKLKKVCLSVLAALILCIFPISAQQPVPIDPGISTGHLGNGLTYYLVNNPSAKDGFADFYFIQKSGSASEQENEKGMTRLLSCHSLLQTRNFPDGEVIRFINNQGMVAANDLNVQVFDDKLVFSLKNVPVDVNPEVLDSALLVFFNFASGANLFSETVDFGKQLYRQLSALRQDTRERTRRELINKVFSGSTYECLNTGDELARLENYSSRDLREFHRKWFRSDLQALIVVGDINSQDVKGKINTLFQALPHLSSSPTPTVPVPPLNCGEEDFVAISDREAPAATIMMNFVLPLPPNDFRGTSASVVGSYLNALVSTVLENRIRKAAETTDIPLIHLDINAQDFAGVSAADNFSITMQTSPDMMNDAVLFLSGILEGMMMNGITGDEYKEASDSYYHSFMHYANKPDAITNEYYAQECISNFLTGTPLPSVDTRKDMLVKMRDGFTVQDVNAYVKYRFGDETFLSVCAVSPKKITEKEIAAAYFKGRQIPREPAPSELIQVTSPVTVNDPIPSGMKTKTSEEPLTKATVFSLQNGVTVVVKQTDVEPGKVYFEAVAKGGLSRAKGNYAALQKRVGYIAALTSPPMPDSLDIRLEKRFTESLTFLSGECSSGDLKALLRQVRLHFNDYAIDDESVGSYKMYCLAESERFLMNSPENKFYSMADDFIKINDTDGGSLDYETIVKFIDDSFTNPADFKFFIVGDIKPDKIKGMCEQFLGTLETNPYRRSSVKEGVFYIDEYPSTTPRTAAVTMEYPRWYHNVKFSTSIAYDLKGMIMSRFIARTLEMVISDAMIRKGVFVGTESKFRMFPSENMTVDFAFVTIDGSEEYEKIITDILEGTAESGIPASEFAIVQKAVLVDDALWENDKTDYWMNILVNRYIYGKDFYTDRRKVMGSITADEFNTALREALSRGAILKTRVVPKKKTK